MAYAKSFGFGSGFMFMTPATTNPTPVRVGVMQNVSIEISFDEKPLYGQNQFPEAVARGKAKASCKCEFAQIDSQAISSIFLGGTPVAGQGIIVDLEAQTLTGTSKAVSHSGTAFSADLGVFYATTGQPLSRAASGSEAAGVYSVTTSGTAGGTYVFASADSTASLLFSYAYDAATGFKTAITNQPMGTFARFQTDLFQNNPEVSGGEWGARLYACASSKLSLATKQDDWIIPSMDFSIFANAAGKVLDFNTPN